MWRLFNEKSEIASTLQTINLVSLCVGLYQVSNDPQSSKWDASLDILTHVLTIMVLRDDDNLVERMGSSILNMMRLGAIFTLLGRDHIAFPMAIIIDALIHSASACNTFFGGSSENEANQRRISMS